MRTDLCYVISHGFAARMLFQTSLINRLTEKGLTVAIITTDPDDDNIKRFRINPNVQVFENNEKATAWDDEYNFKRKYYLEDIKKNPVLWEKHIYSLFYSSSLHPWKRVRPLYYYLVYTLKKYFPSIRQKFVEKESQYLQSKAAQRLIDKIKPRLVIGTYPVNLLEAKTLYAAQQSNIPTMLHLLSWDNITSKGRFPVVPEYYIVWGEIMYKELKEYYKIEDNRIFTCGVPHFDNHIDVAKQNGYRKVVDNLGLNPDNPYLFFAMSAPRFAPREIDIVEWLAGKINQNEWGDKMQLIVRPHPQNVQGWMRKNSWLKRLDRLGSGRVAIDYPRLVNSKIKWSMEQKDMDQLSNLLAGCSLCINSGSTVSIDALMLNKPVLLTSFDGNAQMPYWNSARRLVDYTHLKKLVALGGASVTRSYEDFTKQIHLYINNPKNDIKRRKKALLSQCYKDDGQSTERVVKAVQAILQNIANPQTENYIQWPD